MSCKIMGDNYMRNQDKVFNLKVFAKNAIQLGITAVFVTPGLSAAESAGFGIEEVVVTARKRVENLQDTPVAITAMSSETLDRRMIGGTEQLDQVSPNLQFATYGPITGNSSASQVFIRGIGQTDATSSVDPGVGLYIDDVYIGQSVGGAMDFRDIANVQILRGPQGTLFGRNTIGGAVLLTTAQPGDDFGGKVKLGLGEDELIEFSGAVDIPLTDTLKSRFTYGTRKREGYVFREDGTDLGDDDTYTLTGKLLWEASDDFNLTIKLDYSEEDENGVPLVFAAINENAAFPAALSVAAGCPGATFPPPSVPTGMVDSRCANDATWQRGEFKNAGTAELESTLESWGFAAIANWELSENWSLKSITSYRELDWGGKRDADNTGFLILHTIMESEGEQLSQELQLNYSSEGLNGVLGLFYYEDEYDETLFVDYTPPPFAATPYFVDVTNNARLDNENWAVFGQFTYDFNDQLSLTLGARYTDETKAVKLNAFQEVGAISFSERFVTQDERILDFTDASISASIQYRWTEAFMTYLSYSEGFKSGGWNPLYNAVQPNLEPTAFNEETAETLEFGFKADISDSLRVNGAIFSTDYTDLQFTFRVGIVPLLFNAGEASIDGAELEFTYAPNENLIIEGSLGYLDASVDSVSNITSSAGAVTAVVTAGNSLPYTPDVTANLGVGYAFHLEGMRLTPRLDYSYTDEQFFDAGNTAEIAQSDAEGLLNFSLTLESANQTWRAVAGVTNLTDETYPVAGNSSLTTATGYAEIAYLRPRTWFLNLQYEF
ncbi:MAG: TonB-dependent receptor [Pseudomonadales bacterium]|nr:TonB-dependent receptor [Pseudomonadales bacterium]MCP5302607.1 TonB-dependent receptor [Pseudomonadales bacterium]